MTRLQPLSRWAGALALALMLTSCAFTNTTTETFQNTSDASKAFTSSTSARDKRASSRAKLMAFTDANFDRLRAEMAVGNGEHLTSLGYLLGVNESHQQAFSALTKRRFSSLFESEQTTPEQVVTRLEREVAAHAHLTQ